MRLFWSIVVVVVLVLLCVWGYQQYQATQLDASGHVRWVRGQPSPEAKAAFDRRNAGEDDAGLPVSAASSMPAYPVSGTGSTVAPKAAPSALPQPAATPAAVALPSTDSQTPVPPNGEAYRGSGVYELYRQGNLTYRMDTATGRTCVAFATLEEWRKPVVMRNGCGRTS